MATRRTNLALQAITPSQNDDRDPDTLFGSHLSAIGTTMELLDAYTQARLLVDMAKSVLSSLGWNRAFLETIFYGSAETALGLQGCPKDEAGFFIGHEPSERATDVGGHEIKSLYDRLSEKQLDLVDDLELKEVNLWDVFDNIESAWRDLTGEVTSIVKPSAAQRKRGLTTLEDLVEENKRNALEYKAHGTQAEANARDKQKAAVVDFKLAQRAKARAARSVPIR